MNWIGWPRLIDSFLRWAGEFKNAEKVKMPLTFLRKLNFWFMLNGLGQLTWFSLKPVWIPKSPQVWVMWKFVCLSSLPMGKPESGFPHDHLYFWAFGAQMLWPNQVITLPGSSVILTTLISWDCLSLLLGPQHPKVVVKQKKKKWTDRMSTWSPRNWTARVWMSNHDTCRHH